MPLPRWLATSTNGYSTPLRCAGAHLPSFLPQARFPLPGSDYSEKCVVKTAEHVWSTSKSWGRRAPGLQVWSFVTTPNRGSYETTPVQVTKPPAGDRKRPLAAVSCCSGAAVAPAAAGPAGEWAGAGRRGGSWAAVGARRRTGRRAMQVVCSAEVRRGESTFAHPGYTALRR